MLATIVSGALSAVVAALIAWTVSRRFPNHGKAFAGISAITFVLLTSLSHQLVVPQVRAWEIRKAADAALDENPFLRTLAERHPEIRGQFSGMMAEAIRGGGGQDAVNRHALEFGRKLVEPYFSKYAPQASDASLVRYVTVMVAVLDDLGGRDPQGCFTLLFGAGGEGAATAVSVSPEHKHEMSLAMAEVVASAINAPSPETGAAQGDALITMVTERMGQRHGQAIVNSLASLANPADPGIDRAGACNATREMYREALRLPPPEAGTLLRFLFAP